MKLKNNTIGILINFLKLILRFNIYTCLEMQILKI